MQGTIDYGYPASVVDARACVRMVSFSLSLSLSLSLSHTHNYTTRWDLRELLEATNRSDLPGGPSALATPDLDARHFAYGMEELGKHERMLAVLQREEEVRLREFRARHTERAALRKCIQTTPARRPAASDINPLPWK